MVAQSASAQRFVPTDLPRIAVAADGTLAAIHERTRISIVEVASCAQLSELATDADAHDSEVAWVGTPPRLLVLSRYPAHSTAHLVDPFGPRTIAELRLESAMRLCTAVGNHALAIGPSGAAVLTATDRGLSPHPFPARAIPTTAGAAGTQFIVALPGTIEEWDPQSRLPKRRLKLPRPVQINVLGGSDRVVWMTTAQQPARIDVMPLVNRGQPKVHELPEPIAHVAAHPRSDLIACIGATSGRVWVIDLDGRAGLRMVGPEGIERAQAVGLVIGRVAGVLAAQAQRPITVVALEHDDAATPEAPRTRTRDSEPPAPRSSLYADAQPDAELDAPATTVTALAWPALATKPVPAQPPKPVPGPQPKANWSALTRSHEDPAVTAFRDRVQNPRAQTAEPFEGLWPDAPPRWRDDIAAWASDVTSHGDREVTRTPPIDAMSTRYELTASLAAAVALLYGAHLLGRAGAAPVELARIAGWPEALGRGALAAKGIGTYRDSRVLLATHVQRALDELPPTTGEILGNPGLVSLLGPCVIVSAGPLAIIAEACVSSVGGAILAAHDGVDPRDLVAEARAYGCAPMLRVAPHLLDQIPSEQPIILVVDDDHTAEQLGLPRLQ